MMNEWCNDPQGCSICQVFHLVFQPFFPFFVLVIHSAKVVWGSPLYEGPHSWHWTKQESLASEVSHSGGHLGGGSLSILSLVFELADPTPISFHVRCWKDDSYGGVGSRKGPACLGVTYSGSWCIWIWISFHTKAPRKNNTMRWEKKFSVNQVRLINQEEEMLVDPKALMSTQSLLWSQYSLDYNLLKRVGGLLLIKIVLINNRACY